ncbi:hypothetical protein [Hyunsoonleella pacifica]|jgi:Na+/phosphate symporter|uniref:Uncharacterized protein n=1 Tax=Hyunsoonleella pacifica TaxID=1080224 RepID=A0A4Q9FSJ1_9FLAO|nr:hypothetical protein [Hyunsoonleella pacifica]TBN17826.1 hypothetical protein EYD46_05805 [Hyunsoonleella pacifica]GGD08645.1 hypothetical protein GCM10011368_08190 [Hyunsoonleella pacifica]
MLFNITIFILALVAVNTIMFFVARLIPKMKQLENEGLKNTEEPIKLNQNIEVDTQQELAPTGS